MRSSALQRQLEGLWTTQDLIRRFRKSAMTIHQWRQSRALPALVLEGDGRPAIRYVPDEIRAWALVNKQALHEA